jgi:CHAT domain-containing protein
MGCFEVDEEEHSMQVQRETGIFGIAVIGIVGFTLGFGLPCAGQQATVPASGPVDKDARAPSVHSVEEGRAALKAAEAAHPGNSAEVASALVDLVYDEVQAAAITGDTLATTDRAVQVADAAQGKSSSLYAIALAAKARVLVLMDRPELARPIAEEALATEQTLGSDPHGLAETAGMLSTVCQRAGDKACAVKYAELEVSTQRGIKDGDPLDLATALDGLMYSRRLNLDMTGAKTAADEAMAIAAKSETVTPEWATIENNAGSFYMIDNQLELAMEHLKKSLNLHLQLEGPDSLALSGVTANLAFVEMALARPGEALPLYTKARDLFARRYGPGNSQTARIDAGYGYALSVLGRPQEAVDAELAAHRLQRERIRLAIRLMPEQQALLMVNTGLESYNLLNSEAVHHKEIAAVEVYQEVVRTRALVTEEMAQRQATLNRRHDPALETLEQELEKERKSVMELQGTPADAKTTAALSDATLRMEKTERELAQRSAAFRADERAQSSELADLRRNLPPGSVLVSYVSYAKYFEEAENFKKTPVPSYVAFVLRRDTERIGVYDLGESATVVDQVKKMRASADAEAHGGGMGSVRNEREYREAGLEVRKRIWDPLKPDIQNAKLVFVAPDGMLDLIPFSALPLDNGGYMVEHGPVIHILTSERDLLETPSGAKKTGLLAVGSPSFELAQAEPAADQSTLREAPITCKAFTDMEFRALPGSLSEVNEIATTWKRWNATEPERLLTGEDATRSRFLDAAPQSRVLHIATHAFVLEKSCGNGNPLLHSGLVFAGANKSRNASILTAQQIASLDLNGVDWAVLSACNTGNGELKDGEGVLGLERSFRVAGAKSVVMALWPVDDQVTREFMRNLYAERFGRHATTADSVWNAARELLKERQAAGKPTHPWYWAGFVGAGAWQ